MNYQTIIVNKEQYYYNIVISRVENKNSINGQFLDELNHILDIIEQDKKCNVVVLEGKEGYFCTGMDFQEASNNDPSINKEVDNSPYMKILRRFSLIPKVIISLVDGQVLAGGMGLVASSDYVISTDRSQFGLSEALWGLIPAMVMPYLIRRIGFQKAYTMTLTTLSISAKEARQFHLVDDLNDRPYDVLKPIILRISRLQGNTIDNIKQYFRKMWIINEQMEETAIQQANKLSADPVVCKNIYDFFHYQKFPWTE